MIDWIILTQGISILEVVAFIVLWMIANKGDGFLTAFGALLGLNFLIALVVLCVYGVMQIIHGLGF